MEKVIFNKFNSVEEFSNWLQVTPQTAAGKKFDYSNEISKSNTEFTGTESFEEAQNLLKYGDKVNADKITATIRKIKAQGKGNETRNKLYNSPCGFMPIVPKVLAGDPQNMLAIKKQRYNSTKVLNIVFDLWVNCGISKEERAEISIKVLNVITGLERKGYRINLYAGCEFELDEKTHAGLLIKIKDSGKYTDILRIAYPLINASFLRRHCFNWLNVSNTPEGKQKRYYGILHKDSERFFSQYVKNASIFNFHSLRGLTEEEIAKHIENAK